MSPKFPPLQAFKRITQAARRANMRLLPATPGEVPSSARPVGPGSDACAFMPLQLLCAAARLLR
jgi:hypothetical protein